MEAAFALTAGNPHHLAALAIGALNRLNAERRVCITTQDLEFAADGIVINDRYFRTTIFSQTILLPEEREAAIRFAQVQKGRKSIPVSEATQLLAAELLDDLREKGILQRYADDQIGVRGVLLARYLESRIIEAPPDKPERENVRKVGLFVDVENVRPHVPAGMSWESVGHALIRYAEQWGKVEPKWAALDPGNFLNPASVRYSLEKATINVTYPDAPRTRENRTNRADAVLIRLITDEQSHVMPDVFVIFAGDHIYYETVKSLLEKGYEIHIVATADSLSGDYRFLETEDARRRMIDGLEGQKLVVDVDLDAILVSGKVAVGE